VSLRKVFVVFLVLAAMVVPPLFANGQGEESDNSKLFVMVPKGVHPYYEPCYEGFQDAAASLGIDTDFVAPQKFDIALQVKVIENLIARGVDGIAISALDDAGLIAVIKEATDEGIMVLTFDAPAPSTASLSYIGTVNESAGYAAGQEMSRILGDDAGDVAVLQGGLGATNLNQRTAGFTKALAEHGINVVTVEDTQADFAQTVNKTEAILEAYPDLKGIFGVSAYGAPGAATVVKEQGRAGDIVIGGFDDLKDTLIAIEDGVVNFCLVQKTYKMGWLSVMKLDEASRGLPIEREIDTGVLIVDKNNVKTYMDEMKSEFK